MPQLDLTLFEVLLQQALTFLPRLIAALVIFILGLYLSERIARFIESALRQRKAPPQVAIVLRQVTRWGLLIIFTITALEWVNFDLTGFIAGLGVAGLALGFALQDVTRNFTAGLLLLLQQPFAVGDYVTILGHTGHVQDINLRTTVLRRLDGVIIHLPNGDVFTSPVVNYSKATPRRVEIPVGVAYGTNLDHVRAVATAALANLPGAVADPKPIVLFQEFGDSSVNLMAGYWIDPAQIAYPLAYTNGVEAINTAFKQHAIEIPFPIRTLYLNQSLPSS